MCELGVLRNFCSSVQLSLTVLVFGVHGKNIFPIFIDIEIIMLLDGIVRFHFSIFSYTAAIF